MIADPFTKALPVAVFKMHAAKMGVLDLFDSAAMWVKKFGLISFALIVVLFVQIVVKVLAK